MNATAHCVSTGTFVVGPTRRAHKRAVNVACVRLGVRFLLHRQGWVTLGQMVPQS